MGSADLEHEGEVKPEPDRLKLEPQPLLEDGADDEDYKLEPSDKKVKGYTIEIYKSDIIGRAFLFLFLFLFFGDQEIFFFGGGGESKSGVGLKVSSFVNPLRISTQ